MDREESNNCLAISSLDKTNQQFHDEEKKHERCQMLCVVEELLSFFLCWVFAALSSKRLPLISNATWIGSLNMCESVWYMFILTSLK